jgi:hypothetical protein
VHQNAIKIIYNIDLDDMGWAKEGVGGHGIL